VATVKTVTSMELKSLETKSIPLNEHYELTLQADSLAILLNKSDLFDYLIDLETQGLAGSLFRVAVFASQPSKPQCRSPIFPSQ
jgi:hypothetical protein